MSLLYRMGTGNGSGGDLKPYIVQFTCDSGYIGQTLTMTYKDPPHEGETVDNVSGTVVLDSTDGKGKLTLYPMHSGNWECSCYSSVLGTTMKKTIELSYWGTTNVSFEDTPNGATVTPTDDVQTWLHCANIWDKQYTIVSQVVEDKTTLNALVQNENANDYLVRSTTFSTTLCENNANNEAMYYLGLYDGCAKKLLADDYWSNVICSADVLLADGQTHLFEKVLNAKVPRMTSDTAPSGKCFASHSDRNSAPYRAFDKTSTEWNSSTTPNEANKSIGYIFTKPVCIKRLYNKNSDDGTHIIKTFILQGSNDTTNGINGTWTDITTISNDKPNVRNGETTYNIVNNKYYMAYRIFITETGYHTAVQGLQFYGREEA